MKTSIEDCIVIKDITMRDLALDLEQSEYTSLSNSEIEEIERACNDAYYAALYAIGIARHAGLDAWADELYIRQIESAASAAVEVCKSVMSKRARLRDLLRLRDAFPDNR